MPRSFVLSWRRSRWVSSSVMLGTLVHSILRRTLSRCASIADDDAVDADAVNSSWKQYADQKARQCLDFVFEDDMGQRVATAAVLSEGCERLSLLLQTTDAHGGSLVELQGRPRLPWMRLSGRPRR